MSWLSELFSGSSDQQIQRPSVEQVQNYYDQVKANNPAFYETIKQFDPKYSTIGGAGPSGPPPGEVAPTPAPAPPEAPQTGGPEDALQRLSAALPSGFESTYLPDTLDDPFIANTVAGGRTKADQFIANMFKRGTLSDSARAKAIAALDAQTPGVTSKIGSYGTNLLGTDRASLTNLANTGRTAASQTPYGTDYDPTGLVSQIASTGGGLAGSFGDRFKASIPAGDIYDTSGIGDISGAVTSSQNVSYDPYAVEGGKLKSGLEDTEAPVAKKKRTTEVF